jgi:hypothetical protein
MGLRQGRDSERKSERVTGACTRQQKKDALLVARYRHTDLSNLLQPTLQNLSAEAQHIRASRKQGMAR